MNMRAARLTKPSYASPASPSVPASPARIFALAARPFCTLLPRRIHSSKMERLLRRGLLGKAAKMLLCITPRLLWTCTCIWIGTAILGHSPGG